MAITKIQFQKGEFKTRNECNNHPVLSFLRKDKEHAYRADEIAKATKMNTNTIRHMLGKFVKRKLIEHKTPYYIAK